tara:strand:+ start:1369 stop:2148 length:780 start_codon:yes stop_codon:yes gene_type:complete
MDTRQEKQSKVLVIGESCLDIFVRGKVKRLCPEAPAPVFIPVETFKNTGMAGNVSENLRSLSIDHDIITNKNFKSITKTRYIDDRTNTMFIRVDKNDSKIKRCDISQIKFSLYSAIIVVDYCKGFLTEEDITHITKNHNKVFLDTKKILGNWCNAAFIIKINNFEFERSQHALNKKIREKVICTQGSSGCLFREKLYPVKEVEIKDVSGAGDTFLAALVALYVKTQNLEKSIIFANMCATQVVQQRGVTPAIMSWENYQ